MPTAAKSPWSAAPTRPFDALLGAARGCLRDAARSDRPGDRYVAAHLAALRAASAVLAVRARGSSTRRPTSVWALIETLAPELGEWTAFFTATARKRQAVEAGAVSVIGQREADDLMRDAERFLGVVEALLGIGAATGLPRAG